MASSSSSSSSYNWRYDVFLSFRGEDTRTNFVSHLYKALEKKGIYTFKDDDKFDKGEPIPKILKAIEESKFAVVVFSKHYAFSRWCMDELVKILECMDRNTLNVFPIFYDIDPSEVKNGQGSFEEAFAQHESDPSTKRKVQIWRSALRKAAYLSGWVLGYRDEATFIEEIVQYILHKLGRLCSSNNKAHGLVGINSRVEKMESLLCRHTDDVHKIGIWGMGGIGKTTLARYVYDQVSHEFEACCFLSSVRENAERYGVHHLREKLFVKLLNDGNLHMQVPETDSDIIRGRLQYRSALIVLDDVSDLEQLRTLVGSDDWFGPRSRIIVTTRDKHLLVAHGVNDIYEVEGLSYSESLQLFNQYMKHPPRSASMELLRHSIDYAKGLPLALMVLASFLCDKTISEWEDELSKLQGIPAMEIQNVLRISFDGLDDFQRSIFLDIACFFKGEDKEYVTKVWEGCGFFPEVGLRVLRDKSLIRIVDNKLWMHDLIQEMGCEIVRQEHLKEPGNRSRLWKHEDVRRVLEKNMGTAEIEVLVLDISKINIHVRAEVLCKMKNLRILKIYYGQLHGSSEYCFGKELQQNIGDSYDSNLDGMLRLSFSKREGFFRILSNEIRCLHWYAYPLKALPSNFYPENLVELNLSHCRVIKFWTEVKIFNKLKFIKLSYSKELIMTPNFEGTPNLEILILEGCTNLVAVHSYIGYLKNLIFLNLKGCSSLQSLPSSISMSSLEVLILSGCSKLKNFPEIDEDMQMLSEVYLDGTAIKELPTSIQKLAGLTVLSIKDCKTVESLPRSIGGLNNLKILDLSGCLLLEKLPEDLGLLENLEELHLDGIAVTELPSSLQHLRRLKILSFHGSRLKTTFQTKFRRYFLSKQSNSNLIRFPPLLFSNLLSLTSLDLSNCNLSDEAIPDNFGQLTSLRKVNLSRNNFMTLPSVVCELPNLEVLYLAGCPSLFSLPPLPASIFCIDAPNCPSLTQIEYPLGVNATCMRGFNFFNCPKLYNTYSTLAVRLLKQHVKETPLHLFAELSIITLGWGIREWYDFQFYGSKAELELPSHWFNDTFKGVALWTVFTIGNPRARNDYRLDFQLKCNSQNLIFDTGFCINGDMKINESHVWLRYIPSPVFKVTRYEKTVNKIKANFLANNGGLSVTHCGIFPVLEDNSDFGSVRELQMQGR